MQSLVGVVLLSMAGVATSNWIIDRKLKIIQTLFPYQGKICLRLHSPIQLITSEIICQEKIQNNSLTTWYTRGFLILYAALLLTYSLALKLVGLVWECTGTSKK